MSTTTIRKALIDSFGDASHVSVVTAEIEAPPSKHVQVAVAYSGFNGSDMNMRLGHYPLQKSAPLTPGYVLVGRVEQNGPDSKAFQQGDVVAAMTVYDAEAERINVPEKHLIKVPDGLDHQQTTALILDWNTAYGMVMQAAKVAKGQKVFVHGMSGAVGFATMKLAQLQGAEVYGTASARNHDAIIAEGGHPFVYNNKDWMKAMKDMGGAHAVFDPLGFESWDESYSILHKDDRSILVGYGGNQASYSGESRSVIWTTVKLLSQNLKFGSKKTKFYYIARDQDTFKPNLLALFDLVQQGKINVPIKKVWKLEDVQQAHRDYEKGLNGVGSLLIDVAGTAGSSGVGTPAVPSGSGAPAEPQSGVAADLK